jgi:A/G-specific adenine glycosylase
VRPEVPEARRRRLQRDLLAWYGARGRALGWRQTRDPYAILVSEVMLQQTQAARVEPLWRAFLDRFPTVPALAAGAPGDVLLQWRGLGYNRRAVALHRCARLLVDRHGGAVPDDLAALRALPGVGPYTGRAVLAFAFGHHVAPVDTNVGRVLVRAAAGRPLRAAEAQALADAMVPAGAAAAWSHALMDLGAGLCTARAARCAACPLERTCAWRRSGGDDPAASGGRPGPPVRFGDSDRFHRGRLVDALRSGPVARSDLPAAAASEADTDRAGRIASALVADELAQWHDGVLRLPGDSPAGRGG